MTDRSHNDGRYSRAIAIARVLRAKVRAVERANDDQREPTGSGEWCPLSDNVELPVMQGRRCLNELLKELNSALDRAAFEHDEDTDDSWVLGKVKIRFPIRRIHGGFVEPLLIVPVVSRVPPLAVSFLIKVPGFKDALEREHHGVGYHYHYLDQKRRRSNRVLCWDTRAEQKEDSHPLFQEEHGEGFPARPDLWGDHKRISFHDACLPDLQRKSLTEFRCASSKALPVWPTSSVLTPITR